MEGDSTMLHIESPGFLQLVAWLPDDMLLNHVLNTLTVSDRSSLRATCKRAQGLANLAVKVCPDITCPTTSVYFF